MKRVTSYLSPPRFRVEPLSDSFVRLIDIMFAVTMTQGFVVYRADIVSPSFSPQISCLLLVYTIIVLSWIGYHRSIIRYPYNRSNWSPVRLGLDIVILLVYAFLVFAGKELSKVLLGLGVVFVLYAMNGLVRILEWRDRKVSKPWLAAIFAGIFFFIYWLSPFSFWASWIVIALSFPLLFIYRLLRQKLGYPGLFVVGIDVDGVLADQVPAILQRIGTKKGLARSLTKDSIVDWNFAFEGTNISKEIEEALLDPSFVREMPVVQGSTDAMKEFYGRFHVVIATSRPLETQRETVDWLRNNFPFHEFVNTRETGKEALGLDVLVDDNLENVAKFAASNGVCVLFSQPWNQRDFGNEIEGYMKSRKVVRCTGWHEVVQHLKTVQGPP